MRAHEFIVESESGPIHIGWVSPQEKYYPCKYGGHAERAQDILSKFGYLGRPADAYMKCLKKGYIRVESSTNNEYSIQALSIQKSKSLIHNIIRRLPVTAHTIYVEAIDENFWKLYTLEEAEKAF